MTINRTSLTSESVQTNTDAIIEVRNTAPQTGVDLDPPDIPGRLLGYYNGSTGFVELYVVSPDGKRLLEI